MMMRRTVPIVLLTIFALITSGFGFVYAEQKTVLSSIDIDDMSVEIKASGSFTYTVYQPLDPFLLVVELPGVGIGTLADRITTSKKGITEIKVSEMSEGGEAVKIEILLSAPSEIEPSYQDGSLKLSIKSSDTAVVAETPAPTDEAPKPNVPTPTEASKPNVPVSEVDTSKPNVPVSEVDTSKPNVPVSEIDTAKPNLFPASIAEAAPTPVAEAPQANVPTSTEAPQANVPTSTEAPQANVPTSTEAPQANVPTSTEVTAPVMETPKPQENVKRANKPLHPISGNNAHEIDSVTFDTTANTVDLVIKGDGRMIPNIFTLENQSKIVIDVPNVSMKAALPNTVINPIKAIRYGMHKDKTRIVIELREKTEFTAVSAADSIVVSFKVNYYTAPPESKEVKPQTAEGADKTAEKTTAVAKKNGAKPVGKTITLDFQNADAKSLFRLLGDIAGYNVVIPASVTQTITLKLVNVPWEQALDIMLETLNLESKIEGNILKIAPAGQFSRRKEDEARSKETTGRVEPLIQEVVQINYAEAAAILSAIDSTKLKSVRGSVTVDARMNTLIIQDTRESIDKIKDLIKIMDVPKSQVMIEAKIVEVSTDYAESLGVKWGGTVVSTGVAPGAPTSASSATTDTASISVNTPISGTSGPGGIFNLAVGTTGSARINMSIEAIESIGKGKKLANPRILTMDNDSASIQQGVAIPVQTTTASGSTTQFVSANLNLTVTPRITPDGYVLLKVSVNNDTPVSIGGATGINRQSVSTQALVKNNETLVLGGIYSSEETYASSYVPYLNKIPIIGWFFKTNEKKHPTKELLIFITPTIVRKAQDRS